MLNAVSHYLVSAHIIAQIEWMSRLIGLSAGRQGARPAESFYASCFLLPASCIRIDH